MCKRHVICPRSQFSLSPLETNNVSTFSSFQRLNAHTNNQIYTQSVHPSSTSLPATMFSKNTNSSFLQGCRCPYVPFPFINSSEMILSAMSFLICLFFFNSWVIFTFGCSNKKWVFSHSCMVCHHHRQEKVSQPEIWFAFLLGVELKISSYG